MHKLPNHNALVTAVMITGKTPQHEPLARLSVEAFLAQTHPYRELVIINDGTYRLDIKSDKVREIRLPKRSGQHLGALRNIGLENAKGQFIIQWDDDDWHHPDRIATQLRSCRPDGCTMLLKQIRCSLLTGGANVYQNQSGIHGTIMHGWPMDVHYPNESRGEDSDFQKRFGGKRRVIIAAGEWLYMRFFHGRNTWNETHIMRKSKGKSSWELSDKSVRQLRKVLVRYAEEGLLGAGARGKLKRR